MTVSSSSLVSLLEQDPYAHSSLGIRREKCNLTGSFIMASNLWPIYSYNQQLISNEYNLLPSLAV